MHEKYIKNPQNIIFIELKVYPTGSCKKHETWKTNWGLLKDSFERIKCPSIKTTNV